VYFGDTITLWERILLAKLLPPNTFRG